MGLFEKLLGGFGARGKATTVYKRGMEKADQRDWEGAIVEYSAVIEMDGAPGDVKAMALFNRAIAYSHAKDDSRAESDLQRVLSFDAATTQVKTAARERIKRMAKYRQRQQGSQQGNVES